MQINQTIGLSGLVFLTSLWTSFLPEAFARGTQIPGATPSPLPAAVAAAPKPATAGVHVDAQIGKTKKNFWNRERHCREWDPIKNPMQVEGRRQWALKCGYIDETDMQDYCDGDQYPSFRDKVAPKNAIFPCLPFYFSKQDLVVCQRSCFSSDTGLMFEQGQFNLSQYQSQAQAPAAVVTMAENASLADLAVTAHPYEPIAPSPYRGPLAEIILTGGQQVTVTPDHPMVDGSGNIIDAADLAVGQSLLTRWGPKKIISIASVDFVGSLWNIAPESTTAKGNLIVSEGIFSGGLGYFSVQNKEYRIRLRTDLASKLATKQKK